MHGQRDVGDVRHGSTKRVASAVGEGSSAVRSVYEHLDQLAHNAVRRDYRLVTLQALFGSLVDGENARLVAATRSNYLRRHAGVDVLLTESKQLLQPLTLLCILQQRAAREVS